MSGIKTHQQMDLYYTSSAGSWEPHLFTEITSSVWKLVRTNQYDGKFESNKEKFLRFWQLKYLNQSLDSFSIIKRFQKGTVSFDSGTQELWEKKIYSPLE